MVGHSGKLEATKKAVEATDENLGRVVDRILEKDGYAIIFADHGNADTVITDDGQPHTAHTTVPVPVIVTKKGLTLRGDVKLADVRSEEHTSELQSRFDLVCRLLLEKKKTSTMLSTLK